MFLGISRLHIVIDIWCRVAPLFSLVEDLWSVLDLVSPRHWNNLNHVAHSNNLIFAFTGGFVKLQSNNPLDAPLINPAYFESEFDLFVGREALKAFSRFMSAPAWRDVLIGPAGALANATTDALLNAFLRNVTTPGAHPVGTASMSKRGDSWGVVNPDLVLKGASGLRVVDASIMVGGKICYLNLEEKLTLG